MPKQQQRTIKKACEYEGVGLFTGAPVHLRFLPAPVGSGIAFVRTDLPHRPRIPAHIDQIVPRLRRTAVGVSGAEVETVEHLISCSYGLGLDNMEIEIDGPEVPAGDGSARAYMELFEQIGFLDQGVPRNILTLKDPVYVEENGATLIALPDESALSITYYLDYSEAGVAYQQFSAKLTDGFYAKEIGPARTFVMKEEAEALVAQGLGKGATYENTLIVDNGKILDNTLRFENEFVRHKILDLIGDLGLLGSSLHARIIAFKSGHAMNARLVRELNQRAASRAMATQPTETLLDIREIVRILPHRYPFLLVDKVIELDGWHRAVGIKNVTFNEPFFQGHFPDRPIMPGVLQLEAMAQLSGVLLMRKADNVGKLAVLLAIDGVKLRKTVVPGDQLRIEAETLKVKARTGLIHAQCTVDGQLASQADLKFMLVDPE